MPEVETEFEVGVTFVSHARKPYTDRGVQGVHEYDSEWRVTRVTPDEVDAVPVRVFNETGKPSFVRGPTLDGARRGLLRKAHRIVGGKLHYAVGWGREGGGEVV